MTNPTNEDINMTIKLPQTLKQNWINALRSNQYKQYYGHLHCYGSNAHCVIGVLDILTNYQLSYGKVTYDQWCSENGIYDINTGDIPNNITLIYNGNVYDITLLNDKEKLTFPQLADLIEEQMIGY
jgi:hypothetical protein